MKGGEIMKHFVLTICLAYVVLAWGLTPSTVDAQSYPKGPIQLVVPNVAGSLMDITGRLIAEELGKILGVQIIVMNKPGAAMTLGTDAVVRSKNDGYTILYTGSSAMVYTRVTHPETVPYNPEKDLEPLGLSLFLPLTVAVQESSPWKTFGELVDYARKNPGKVRVSTPGQGSTDHFNLEIYQSVTGVQFTHVPFKGGEAVVTALLGGHVEVTDDAFSKVIPHVNAGKLRILLVSKKMSGFPNIPTMTELGYKQDLLTAWMALFAPAGLPEEVKKVLVPAVEKAIKNPELKAKIEKMGGYLVDYKSPAELKKLVAEDYETAHAIAKKIGLRK
jgi:tripartite-type tricarboxylate transporter receptor subunit TctC